MYYTQVYFINLSIAHNNIGDVGVQYLSKAKWHNLTILYLGILLNVSIESNKIGDDGVSYLINGNWRNLTQLNLRIHIIIYIQVIIIQDLMENN